MSRGELGSSLVEAMVAGFVVAVGLLNLGALSTGLTRGNREGALLLAAIRAVEARTEGLLAAIPLDRAGELARGAHPAESAGVAQYEGLDRLGNVVAPRVGAGAPGVALLRDWTVFEEALFPCLRRVRVRVLEASGTTELAAVETLVPCAAEE